MDKVLPNYHEVLGVWDKAKLLPAAVAVARDAGDLVINKITALSLLTSIGESFDAQPSIGLMKYGRRHQ